MGKLSADGQSLYVNASSAAAINRLISTCEHAEQTQCIIHNVLDGRPRGKGAHVVEPLAPLAGSLPTVPCQRRQRCAVKYMTL